MRVAWLNLRYTPEERVRVFAEGFAALGYEPQLGCPRRFDPQDVFCTWNRIGHGDHCARLCEQAGVPVIVTENASWGNDFLGRKWYTLARDYHNESGRFPIGDESRWDSLCVELKPFRTSGETVILPQRGIGPAGHAMPRHWLETVRHRGRIRQHLGRFDKGDLEVDLASAGKVLTWGSGAAVKALMLGVPVESHMSNWIGEQDNTDAGRLTTFRRLAWAQFEMHELSTGEPMRRLLDSH